ncbi:MAG: arsenic resistance N-acetyltransferase ArsN2 [Chloroflexota bacterium]
MEAYSSRPESGSGPGLAMVVVRASGPADLPAVRVLLTDASLPLDGVDEAFGHGVVAESSGEVVGAAAIEPYGADGLLRSVVVASSLRRSGLGRSLVGAAEDAARALGIRDLYLLTETAIDWFPRLGYTPLARDAAPATIAASVEFTVSCKDTGVLMHRRLDGRG